MKALVLLLLLAAAASVRAQTPSQTPGEPVTPQAYPAKSRSPREQDEPLALAINLAFGATVWAQVQVSTAGSLGDLNYLAHEGFYKREIIELVLISVDARRPLKDVVDRRRKGLRLSTIAHDLGLDPDGVERDAIAVEETLDRDYLPRFPGHTLMRLDDD